MINDDVMNGLAPASFSGCDVGYFTAALDAGRVCLRAASLKVVEKCGGNGGRIADIGMAGESYRGQLYWLCAADLDRAWFIY